MTLAVINNFLKYLKPSLSNSITKFGKGSVQAWQQLFVQVLRQAIFAGAKSAGTGTDPQEYEIRRATFKNDIVCLLSFLKYIFFFFNNLALLIFDDSVHNLGKSFLFNQWLKLCIGLNVPS